MNNNSSDDIATSSTVAITQKTGEIFDESDTNRITIEHEGRYSYIGGSRDTAEIGRGGLGRVLIALDEHFGRKIAIKELLPGVLNDGDMVRRFLREARVTARLEHPNIVPVYELGKRPDGSLYYTMKLVRGKTLSTAIRNCSNLDERLKLLSNFVNLCHAIAYAHNHGVVHRDIKTENVMVGEFGETVVLDWGLAKVRGREDIVGHEIERVSKIMHEAMQGATVDGSTIGTPSYMSPEQARGNISEIDERSDVWSLGAVLYEILTGRPPFTGKNPIEIMSKVILDPVVPPRMIDEKIPPELSSICEKALSKEKALRYGSAKEIAEEIEAYRSGEKVRYHEYTSMELLKRFASKNKAVLISAVIISLTLITSLIFVSFSYKGEKTARLNEHKAVLREQQARRREKQLFLEANFYIAQAFLEKAERKFNEKKYGESKIFAAASLLYNPGIQASPYFDNQFVKNHSESNLFRVEAFSLYYLSEAFINIELQDTLTGKKAFHSVSFSPDGKYLVAAGADGKIHILNVATGEKVFAIEGHREKIATVMYSPDGKYIASAGYDKTIKLWDSANWSLVRELADVEGAQLAIAISSDSTLISAGGLDKRIRIWDIQSGKIKLSFNVPVDGIRAISFSPDGKSLSFAGNDSSVSIFDIRKNKIVRTLRTAASRINDVAFSSDGRLLAAAGWDAKIYVWDTGDYNLLYTITAHDQGVTGVSFTPANSMIITAGMDGLVKIWNSYSGKLEYSLASHNDFIWGLAISPDGNKLATAGQDKTVKIWNLSLNNGSFKMEGHNGRVTTAAFSPSGNIIASGGEDKTVRLWSAEKGNLLHTLKGHSDVVCSVAFSPDGKYLASGSWDNSTGLWEAETGNLVKFIAGHKKSVKDVKFSPNGKFVATAGTDGTVKLWSVPDGEKIMEIAASPKAVRAIAFSPDGKLLASAGENNNVDIWDAEDGKLIRTLSHNDWVTGIDFSPDGKMIVTASKDSTITLWSAPAGNKISTIKSHTRWVNRVIFSPDGKFFASISDDRTARIFETSNRQQVFVINLDVATEATSIAFSPDGNFLLIGDSSTLVAYYIKPFLSNMNFAISPEQLLEKALKETRKRLKGLNIEPAE